MNTNAQFQTTVERWFRQTNSIGLLLPDGWFGKPYDNHHKATLVLFRPNRFLIELDEQLYLIISSACVLTFTNEELSLGFGRVIFDWRSFGSHAENNFKVYDSGTLSFVRV